MDRVAAAECWVSQGQRQLFPGILFLIPTVALLHVPSPELFAFSSTVFALQGGE